MKIGIYEKALAPHLTMEEKVRVAQEVGFHFIEMSIDESDERLKRLDWTHRDIIHVRHILENSPISIPSICLSGHRRYPFGSMSSETRAKAIDMGYKAIDLAYALGVRIIQIAGYDVYYEESTRNTEEYYLQGLRTCLEYAAEAQVILAIEIMDHPFINSISRYKYIYDTIPSPWLKVYPDIGNLWAWQPTAVKEELLLCPDHIVGIHLKDTLTVKDNFQGKFRDLSFGEGEVNFVEVFHHLQHIHYTGPFLLELWYKDDNAINLHDALSWINARMKEAGYAQD